ncbi:MAG: AAA family ATPase, partial [Clostridia bacterium]|nr:AAA family ATPase [Clostridia bacterium]
VRLALEKIREHASYLRYKDGRYYASKEPTIPNILAGIRKTVTRGQVEELLKATARKVITDTIGLFHLEHDVSLPEHVPDGKGRPVLGVVSPVAEEIDVEAVITTKGPNRPREQQNLVFLLVPETVKVKTAAEQPDLFGGRSAKAEEVGRRVEGLAKQVKAMRLLSENPQRYGLSPRHLEEEDFRKDHAERENALVTAVAEIYTGFYYAGPDGRVVRREIKTGGGEGGTPFLEQVRET